MGSLQGFRIKSINGFSQPIDLTALRAEIDDSIWRNPIRGQRLAQALALYECAEELQKQAANLLTSADPEEIKP